MKKLRVYHIQHDGGFRVVEAASFAEAIAAWRQGMNAEGVVQYPDDFEPYADDDEPEQVVLLSEDPVLR